MKLCNSQDFTQHVSALLGMTIIFERMLMPLTKSHELLLSLVQHESGNLSYILKAFFVRHSLEYKTSDSDRKVIQNLYSQVRIHIAR